MVIDGQTDAAPVQAAVAQLQTAIAADPAFATASVESHPDADLTILSARLTGDANSGQALDAVSDSRRLFPQAFAGAPADALVTGKTAELVDLNDVRATYTPIVFAFVLGSSFLLLLATFRSIVIPLKAIALNLLWRRRGLRDHGAGLPEGLGVRPARVPRGRRASAVLPLFLFALLFGLSMDYHVFLLSRVQGALRRDG